MPSALLLQNHLLRDVDLLNRRRAGAIGQETIDDYVALGWLEWHGGALRLTKSGSRLCDELSKVLLLKTDGHDENGEFLASRP